LLAVSRQLGVVTAKFLFSLTTDQKLQSLDIVSEHRLRNDLAETRHIGGWVEAFAQRAGLTRDVRNALDLALVECVTNVIAHAWNDSKEHWVVLRVRASAGEVRVEVSDDGREFNPLTVPPADTTVPLERREPGGLGVHMMRQLMDAVEYRRENGRNILTLIKRTE
jgi:anti-sigma regulatory factor (Ser/Thr protein kinase)